jgi:hypothetical protein
VSAATVAVDVPKLRRAVGNASPEWYGAAFQRAFYRTCRGGVATVAMLDRIATTLGMHYSELLQDMEDVMSADLPKDKVYINAERLREFAAEADYKVNFEFGLKNAMTIAQMRGEKPVELWKVESLAVLLKCLPRAIIQV